MNIFNIFGRKNKEEKSVDDYNVSSSIKKKRRLEGRCEICGRFDCLHGVPVYGLKPSKSCEICGRFDCLHGSPL